jgi:hypothetical protein
MFLSFLFSQLQKRHMLMTINEAYSLFKEEFPEVSVKKSSFRYQRPPHVKLLSELPHNVCVCIYHANFMNLVDALKATAPNVPDNLLASIVCDTASAPCMTNSCSSCSILPRFDTIIAECENDLCEEEKDKQVRYEQWTNSFKHVAYGKFDDIAALIKEKIVAFALHTFVKRQQSVCFRSERERQNVLVLQMDFSENYCLKFQDEIQAMHWVNDQLTIFTCVAWGTTVQSFAIASDDLQHDKGAVLIFFDRILSETAAFSEIYDEIVVFTDGAVSQFKNKYVMTAMHQLSRKINKCVRWEVFAASHGKGAVDGIGGEVKRIVWDSVRSRKTSVTSLDEFVACASERTKKIKVSIQFYKFHLINSLYFLTPIDYWYLKGGNGSSTTYCGTAI